ncbi:MAG: zinc ABC transporter substrate-binding protein [Planctomycetota bacterium]|nr:zinc ABC transporter substrate-binding protein [Planctomycetota bacterium]MDA1163528.1 zinc ABC transporter substrate-binding protein [Planctomycetota bacterium]
MQWNIPRPFTSTSRATGLSGIALALGLICGCSGSNDAGVPNGSSEGTGIAGSASEGGVGDHSDSVGKLNIVTTIAMVTDIVRVVAADRANVDGLIGEGIDPHLFTAGRNDVQKLLAADVVFYCGLMLEGRMADDFARVGRKGKPVFPVTEGIDREKLREPPEFEGHWDPHVWMDVALWSECVDSVAKELSIQDESSAADFRTRADDYRKQLSELDTYIREAVSTIPQEQRYLITAHDAFGYFASAYGIEVKAIQGISTDSQAAISDINSLVDFIVENKVPAIFVESSVSKKNIEAVIEGCGQRGWELRIGAELFSDAMGPPGTYEGTYIGMMDHNSTKITRALGGEAPEHGWQGKLAVSVKH